MDMDLGNYAEAHLNTASLAQRHRCDAAQFTWIGDLSASVTVCA